jgi:transposase
VDSVTGPTDAVFAERLVPDELWDAIRFLLPQRPPRRQGGGPVRGDDRPILAAIVYVALTGVTWRKMPPWCGVSRYTAYRRFTEWSTARVWEQLLGSLGPDHEPDCWCRTVAVAASRHIDVQSARQIRTPDGQVSLAYRLATDTAPDAVKATEPATEATDTDTGADTALPSPFVPVLADRLVPDELWNAIRFLLPPQKRRRQGGGHQRNDNRPILVTVAYIALTDTAWRKMPPWCGVTYATAYRRFTEWAMARVWQQLLDSLGPDHEPDCWCRTVAVAVSQHIDVQSARRRGHPSLAYRLAADTDAINATDSTMC